MEIFQAGISEPVGGCTPNRHSSLPDLELQTGIRRGGAFHPCAGRGLNPRPERSTPAKAEQQMTESSLKD